MLFGGVLYGILLFLFSSCEKNLIEYNSIGDDEFVSDTLLQKDSGKIEVQFFANVNDLLTRAASVSPIETERYATVYAIDTKNDSTMASVVSYYSKAAGTLTPVTNPMKLNTNNVYSLYAVSVNNANTAVPVFDTSDGIATGLNNGLDYLWCGLWDAIPTGTSATYDLTFQHCCTQVLIDLVVEEGITVNSVTSVTITPTDTTGMSWSLFNNGTIGPAMSLSDTPAYMGFKKTAFGFSAAYVMFPIVVSGPTNMSCQFVLNINNEAANRTYALNIPVYQNELQAGYAYSYGVTLQTDTVVFNDANIIDWVTIDVNGNPIIPVQVN